MKKRSRNRSQQEKEMMEQGRLPPGQSLTLKFPVLHYGPVPKYDLSEWDLRIWGEVEEEIRWTWEQVQDLPRTKVRMDIHCVTRWSKFDTDWEGIALQTLVDEGLVRIKPTAKYVLQHCEYGFTANIPLSVAMSDNFLIATHFDGEPLTPDHGYPLRGVIGAIPDRKDIQDLYLWKGGKWLRGLQLMTQDQKGFWEQAGYHNEADVWKEQRFGGQ